MVMLTSYLFPASVVPVAKEGKSVYKLWGSFHLVLARIRRTFLRVRGKSPKMLDACACSRWHSVALAPDSDVGSDGKGR